MASQRRPLLDDSNVLIDAVTINPAVLDKPIPVEPLRLGGRHAFGKSLRGFAYYDFFAGTIRLPYHSAKELFP